MNNNHPLAELHQVETTLNRYVHNGSPHNDSLELPGDRHLTLYFIGYHNLIFLLHSHSVINACMWVCVSVSASVCVSECTRIHVFLCLRVSMWACSCVCTHMHVRVCVHPCV